MVSLQPEDKVHSINITIINDEILEATETFIARLRVLGNQVGINLVNDSLPVRIIDNDCKLHNQCLWISSYACMLSSSSQFPDVILTFDSTSVMVREDEGMLNLTISKQRLAAIPITVVISMQPLEAKRELMSVTHTIQFL